MNRPQSKKSQKSQQDILQAALEEFAQHGFDATTVRDIAARAGVTHGMIRYYFATKEKLWFAAVAFLFERQSEALAFSADEDRTLQHGSRERFAIFLRRYVHYCAKHPEHARILMQETVKPTARMKKALRKHLRDSHNAAIEEVKAFQENGIFKKNAPPESVMYMISGACQNLFALAPEVKVTCDYDALSKEAIEAHADLIVYTFCPID